MHKNVHTNPEKSQKITQHSCCSMLTREKNLKAMRGNGYRFVPKGGTFPTENHHGCCEKLRFVRSSGLWEAYTQTCPKWDKICTTACWCRYMIACQVSWISDEFWFTRIQKQGISMFCRQSTVTRCLNFIPISCMGPKHAPKDIDFIFNQFICTGACVCS